MVLVDTSVWIEFFRKGTSFDLEKVVSLDDIVTCLPIVQEVLQGIRDEQTFRRTREAMLAFPCLESPIGSAVFEDAIGLYRTARRRGVTIRSSVACLIAAVALRSGLAVMHRDRDFAALASISDLQHLAV